MSEFSLSVDKSKHLWNLLKDSEKKLDNSMVQIEGLISERKKNLNKIKELKKRLNSDNVAAVESLEFISSIIVKKDGSYCSKVADLAELICQELNFEKTEILNAKIIAKLHLTGLIFADYNPDEFVLYPVKSASILEKFSGIKNLTSVFSDLDEFFDGSGPNSKKGSKVKREVRVVRGAAFYYYLYHKSLKHSEIKAELDENSGTSLDPNVVSVLYKILVKKDFFSDSGIKCVNLMNLESGMTLESGIFSKRGAMLLPSGTIVDNSMIEKVKAYDKGESVVDSILVKY